MNLCYPAMLESGYTNELMIGRGARESGLSESDLLPYPGLSWMCICFFPTTRIQILIRIQAKLVDMDMDVC